MVARMAATHVCVEVHQASGEVAGGEGEAMEERLRLAGALTETQQEEQ